MDPLGYSCYYFRVSRLLFAMASTVFYSLYQFVRCYKVVSGLGASVASAWC